jgi:glycosyltransferase involved in cell wall biosynthesis
VVGASVTVLVPTIPPRREMLGRALLSVMSQHQLPDVVTVAVDNERLGAAGNRNRMLPWVSTDWVAFLDDDDELLPNHLLVLLQNSSDADVIYTGCTVIGPQGQDLGYNEEWGRFGKPFSEPLLRKKSYLPVTSLVRTHLAKLSSFQAPAGSNYDDWGFYLGLLDQGARFKHVPQKTWIWHHHSKNSSGRPDRW